MRDVFRLWAGFFLCLCVSLSATAQDKVELRLNLTKGEAYPLRTTTKQEITQTLMGQKQQVTNEFVYDYTLRALDLDANGVATVSLVYDRVRNQSSGVMGSSTYDSAAPDQAGNPQASTFGVLIGHEFRMKLAPDGTVSDVTGTEELVARMVDAKKPADEEERKALEEGAKKQWDADTVKETISQSLGVYPGKPVSVGESWEKEVTIDQGFPILFKTTYTLKSMENGVATVDARSVIASDATPSEAPDVPVMVSYSLNGAQSGTLHLDVATGWYRDGHLTQEFGGEAKLEAGGNAGTLSVPMNVKSDVVLEVPKGEPAPAQ